MKTLKVLANPKVYFNLTRVKFLKINPLYLVCVLIKKGDDEKLWLHGRLWPQSN